MKDNFKEKLIGRLKQYREGSIDEEAVLNYIKMHEFEDVDFAKIDHKRAIFKNFPEVIFGIGKTDGQIVEIFKKMAARGGNVMSTRTSAAAYKTLKKSVKGVEYNEQASLLFLKQGEQSSPYGNVAVLTAGTSDIKAAEEAAVTAELSGSRVTRVYDVGVAGIKRLFNNIDKIFNANAVIVAAGTSAELVQRYLKRVPWDVDVVEWPDRGGPGLPPADGLVRTILLDEKGKDLDSAGFAQRIGGWRDDGVRELRFCIGAADGFDDADRAAADLLIAFGRMTWPHMMARAMLAEQLWRAASILSGHPYHRAG